MTRSRAFKGVLRLTSVRWQSESAATCGAALISPDGRFASSHVKYSVKLPHAVQAVEPRAGQIWRVVGSCHDRQYARGHFEISEVQVVARSAVLERPSGDHIIQFMAKSKDFPGVGEVAAGQLWEAFGEELYEVLNEEDEAAVAGVVGSELAQAVIEGWRLFGASDALEWLHRSGFDVHISRALLDVYGRESRQKLEDDPYRTLAFGISWSGADQLATKIVGMEPDDPRRLAAAVESCLYDSLDFGHTALPRAEVLIQATKLLGEQLAPQAISFAIANGVVVQSIGDLLAAPGMEVVESQIASQLLDTLSQQPLCDEATVAAVTKQYEIKTAAETGDAFGLNDAQRAAVLGVAHHAVLLITGGAGVGKTTVLRAIVTLLEHVKFEYRVMTIAGRAARRAAEATGRPTRTIAGYLRSFAKGQEKVETPFALIIDEASMLDVLYAWRLMQTLPEGSRVVLIGDPGQLPPIGPGLTLHTMVGTCIPSVELTQARRFGGEIAKFSREVRRGAMPELDASMGYPIVAKPTPRGMVVDEIVGLYLEDPESTQILAFNREGPVSCMSINAAIQRRLVGKSHTLSADEARVGIKVKNEDQQLEYTGLRRLDKVICNVNLHDEGLQNGSLGQIVEVHASPVMRSELGKLTAKQLDEPIFAEIQWDDGVRRPVTLTVLDALELAYCITTHKSQGSQFDRVILACSESQLLDRAIVYTAITRASKRVVLVGDIQAIRDAVARPPKATERNTTLRARLQSPTMPQGKQ